MSILTPAFAAHWQAVSPILSVRNEAECDRAIDHLNELLDVVGTDEQHSLYGALDTLGTLIQAYEDAHEPMPDANAAGVLAFLMEEHNLRQSDLPEIGSQGVISEILNGKRELNIRQIRALCERFSISAAAFI